MANRGILGGGGLNIFFGAEICNAKVLGESPKMGNSQKWLGEGAKGLLSPGSENGVAPVQSGVAPVRNGFRMGQKTLGRLLLPELKLHFAPSPNHFWEFPIFGLSSRTFGLQAEMSTKSSSKIDPGEKRHININFLLWLTSRWPWDKRLVVPRLTGPKSLCVRLETQEI